MSKIISIIKMAPSTRNNSVPLPPLPSPISTPVRRPRDRRIPPSAPRKRQVRIVSNRVPDCRCVLQF